MFPDVLRPLDVAVGGVREIADLQHQQDVLTGENVDGRLEERADVPRDPLLPDPEQDEQTVADADSGSARVQIADPRLQRLIPSEKIGSDVQRGEEIAHAERPHNNARNDTRPQPNRTACAPPSPRRPSYRDDGAS